MHLYAPNPGLSEHDSLVAKHREEDESEKMSFFFLCCFSHPKLKVILVYATPARMRTSASYLQLPNLLDTPCSHQFSAWNLTSGHLFGAQIKREMLGI